VVSPVEGANAFHLVGTLHDLGVGNGANDIFVPGGPVLLHGPAGELKIFGDSFVVLGVDSFPELPQFFDTSFRWVAGNECCIHGTDRNTGTQAAKRGRMTLDITVCLAKLSEIFTIAWSPIETSVPNQCDGRANGLKGLSATIALGIPEEL
jgi:hypothetical protein